MHCKGKQINPEFSKFIEQAENVTMGNLNANYNANFTFCMCKPILDQYIGECMLSKHTISTLVSKTYSTGVKFVNTSQILMR
jgi:hypothetical protein